MLLIIELSWTQNDYSRSAWEFFSPVLEICKWDWIKEKWGIGQSKQQRKIAVGPSKKMFFSKMEKTFAHHTSNNELTSRVGKSFIKLNKIIKRTDFSAMGN